ncbi:Ser/Thr protein phosphatase, putative [Trichomonas vaginalis G3]|uniref:Ser/Thr protein phosphatase, putative n=1 Tax=Trichomonas vaginalis (strain ATCC PRA-98 / G3) TaxID=412133 RepID=A2EUS8_TRIV3|nr:sphingomyelin catabolic process [Trichomonas vaginalis G3]EAY03606.1 Ser/Thr protein phosphatase, putative [Trichomonas vaginalis G3]KAI5505769.1 sphingomyelin catabolic process [Trichomonas vaginalis G3]|eukprot:XP_001315829.1 Ser/Thr protein phosphatase [Trichomonas vaginalis G3]
MNDLDSSVLLYDSSYNSTAESKDQWYETFPFISTIFGATFSLILIVVFFTSAKPWNTTTILYMNDIHLDWLYSDTGSYKEKVCHTSGISNISRPFGIYGCDAPAELFHSTVKAMKENFANADMIILGGDYVTYTIDADVFEVKNTTKYIYDYVRKEFPDTPIYSLLGNAEYAPDYGYYHNSTLLYKEYANILHIPKDQIKSYNKCANYYIDLPKQNQRLIFVNTVIYNKWHNYTNPDTGETIHPEDPCDQFSWAEKILEDGEKKGLKNALIMHVPSAISFYDYNENWNLDYADKFFNIIKKRPPAFMLCGHTHVDLMLPMFNKQNNTDFISLSSVSISPQHYNNPGFRVYEISKGKLVDYTQYVADISYPVKELKWYPEYTFSDVYKTNDMSLTSILNAIKYIRSNPYVLGMYSEYKQGQGSSEKPFFNCLLSCSTSNQVRQCVDSTGVRNAREALNTLYSFIDRY